MDSQKRSMHLQGHPSLSDVHQQHICLYTWARCKVDVVFMQLNQDDLERMLPRQGFRMDAIFFVGAGKQATKHQYNEFARGLQSDVANKLVAIFKANEKANTNLRAAVNAMLVLNKTKTVSLCTNCAMQCSHLHCPA